MPNTRLAPFREALTALLAEPGAQDAFEESIPTQIAARFDLGHAVLPTPTENPDSIVGGSPTMDFLDCCAVGNTREGFFCSGTLIAANLVVTAGHCTNVEQVFLGGSDITQLQDGEIIKVQDDFALPESDLRVLVLVRNSAITPRHVAQGTEVQGTIATLVGFGNVDFNGVVGYGRKRRVEVLIESLQCTGPEDQAMFGCQYNTEMVAGHRGLNRDSCTGDSGGPLYIPAPMGGYFLLGATSRGVSGTGRTCGDGGIYVRVDQFLNQIQELTGIAVEGPLF